MIGLSTENLNGSHLRRLNANAPGLSRRKVLAACGLTAGVSLLGPAEATAQLAFDVRRIDLSLSEQVFGGDSLSFFLRWQINLDTSEVYLRTHKEAREGDLKTLSAMHGYLRGSLRRRASDVTRLEKMTAEHSKEFEQATQSAISQSPLERELKAEALASLREKSLAERLRNAKNKTPAVVDGILTSLEETNRTVRIPHIKDQKLKAGWICISLNAMLAGAMASGQWYSVPSIITRMKIANCLEMR